jgi:hypothetical protein
MPIGERRVMFLSPMQAVRHKWARAKPLVWLCLLIALIGASVAFVV